MRELLFAAAIEWKFLFLLTCLQTLFYSRVIGLSKKWRGWRLVLVILVIAIFEAGLQLIAMNDALWVSLLFLSIVILYPMIFMGGILKERIFYGIMNLVILLFSILLTSNIMSSGRLVQSTSEITWKILLVCGLMLTIYGALGSIIVHLNTEGRYYLSRQYWVRLTLGFFLIFFGLLIIQSFNRVEADRRFRLYLSIISVSLLVIWLLLYSIFYFICRYFSKTIEANTLLIQNDRIEQYMVKKQESDERIQVLSHDLKHSLIQWRIFAEKKDDIKTLQGISEYEEQLQSSLLINVENENANAIINQKKWEADQSQVRFQVDGVFHDDLLISKLDLCSLLGNLLDNAFEAAVQVQIVTLRQINLTIRRKGNLLIVVAENGYAVEPVMENGVFITQKEDKEHHALGMRSIEKVVEKYNGTFNHSYKDGWFKITIMLQGYQSILSDEK